MTILEHIAELRDRLVKACVALVLATAVAGIFLYQRALNFLLHSYCQVPASYRIASAAGNGSCGLLVTGPLDAFGIRVKISLVLGLLLALPVVAWQVWRFITPGLHPREKRYAIPFCIATTLLFAFGVWVAFFTLPKAISFLVVIGGHGLISFFAADRYLTFVLVMGLAFGVTFEFPLVLVSLSLAGVLSSRAMLKSWRPAIVVIIVVAAVVTPSQDPISLFAMAIPMWVFYFGAAAVAKFLIEPARDRRRA